jgi:molybdopterin-guanine dinucleotide biosynthesis protein A
MNFGAVILAGGMSSRMGRDKAMLEFEGETLLARQIRCAREAGARQVIISARHDSDYPACGCPVLADAITGAGPLAGIARAFQGIPEPLLLVLAVDMPRIAAAFLRELHGLCADGIGAIPCHDATIEPLAAFYPKTASRLAQQFLAKGESGRRPGPKDFAAACVTAGLARFVPVTPTLAARLQSWNRPADLPR